MYTLKELQFIVLYHISHHYLKRAQQSLVKQGENIGDLRKFKKYGKRTLRNFERCGKIQNTMDELKEDICKKNPKLRD